MKETKRPDVSFVWNILDNVLHFTFRHNELGKVILPFVVLRRIDCCLAPVNDKVRTTFVQFKDKLAPEKLVPVLKKASSINGKSLPFYNTSNYSFEELLQNPANIDMNFRTYLNGFNEEVKEVLDCYQFDSVVSRIVKEGLLYNMIQAISNEEIIRPEISDDIEMGYVFEEIIRLANAADNESAGEHFTPRDIIRLMSKIIFDPVKDELNHSGIIRSIYDPTCGTGGMVNVGKRYILEELCTEGNIPTIKTYGQELNAESYAIARSEAMITGVEAANIQLGNTLTNDKFSTSKFHFIMANPPYGVTWKKDQTYVTNESMNPEGRFYAGMPRTSDGQFLFVQHMLSKMHENGSRVGVVTSGSPLFTGGAGSGESNIRKWILENDWLETIVSMPGNLFYNTGIGTYIWIFSNKKEERRKGKVQLINAESFYKVSPKSLGNKRYEINEDHILQLMEIYNAFEDGDYCKIFDNKDFGYLELTVEQPLRNSNGELVDKKGKLLCGKGKLVADANLRYTERVPLKQDAMKYFEEEVKPHIDKDAWLDLIKTKIGYEINFQQYFYKYHRLEESSSIAEHIQARHKELIILMSSIFKD